MQEDLFPAASVADNTKDGCKTAIHFGVGAPEWYYTCGFTYCKWMTQTLGAYGAIVNVINDTNALAALTNQYNFSEKSLLRVWYQRCLVIVAQLAHMWICGIYEVCFSSDVKHLFKRCVL